MIRPILSLCAALSSIAVPTIALACEANPELHTQVYESFLARQNSLTLIEPRDVPEIPFTREDGTQGYLTDFRGVPTIATFWFPDCPQCKLDTPELNAMLEKHGKRTDISFVQISIRGANPFKKDFQPAEISQFLERSDFNNIDAYVDQGQRLFVENCLVGTPTHVVMNSQGQVVRMLFGALDWTGEVMDGFIERVAAQG